MCGNLEYRRADVTVPEELRRVLGDEGAPLSRSRSEESRRILEPIVAAWSTDSAPLFESTAGTAAGAVAEKR